MKAYYRLYYTYIIMSDQTKHFCVLAPTTQVYYLMIPYSRTEHILQLDLLVIYLPT